MCPPLKSSKENTTSTNNYESKSVANNAAQHSNNLNSTFGVVDNRSEAIAQRKLQMKMNDQPSATGLNNTTNVSPIVQRTSWAWVGGIWVAQDNDEPHTPMPAEDGKYEWEYIDTNVEEEEEEERDPNELPENYVSPYNDSIDAYDDELGGAVVRVEDNFVVIVEHYQLKHNPDLGILQAGGPFLGKKGSQLDGGWAAHTNEYSVQILNAAREIIEGLPEDANLPFAPGKLRLDSIDAYISISKDGLDWIINYHGNPPE